MWSLSSTDITYHIGVSSSVDIISRSCSLPLPLFSRLVQLLWCSARYGSSDCRPCLMWDRGDGDLYWLHEHSFHVHYTSRAAPNELIYVFNVWIRQYVSKRLSSRLWLFANSHSPGPILGGAFVNSSATWRSSFYINLLRKSSSCTCVDLLAPFALSSPGFEVPPASNLYRLGRLRSLIRRFAVCFHSDVLW